MRDGDTRSHAVLLGLAALFVLLVVFNHDLPLVRNSLVYARASQNILLHGFDPLPVVADSKLSYDKPIGFALLAAPFVAAFGNHIGLYITSLLGTLAYLASLRWFFRVLDPFGFDARERTWAFLFAAFSPIVVYQSWSAHPDSLFAALYVTAFCLARRIVERATFVRVVSWTLTLLAAVLLKNYGMILLPSCGLYFLCHVKRARSSDGGKRGVLLVVLASAFIGAVIAAGWTRHNPLMRFEGEGGGVGQYGKGDWWIAMRGTLAQTGIALALNVQLALLALRKRSFDRATVLALVCFPLPYVFGLMLFPTTFYNMRYFIPLFPFTALLAVAGLRGASTAFTKLVTRGFVAIAALLVLVFNVVPVHARVEHFLPRLEVNWIGVPLSLLDNLRITLVRRETAWIDNLNANVPDGGVVYMLDVNYYGDARHGVYERAGLMRKGIVTRYTRGRGFHADEARYWLLAAGHNAEQLAKLGTVTDLGHDLFRIDAQVSAPR